MTALKPEDLARIREKAVRRGCTNEAINRFAERYHEHCQFRPDGSPIGIVPRLQLALQHARKGWGKERPGGAGLCQDAGDSSPVGRRKIFDVELPADKWNPEPYMIRILTDPAVTCVITVLPLEFRHDIAARKKHRELRRIIDEDITQPETPTEKVPLPPPVKLGANLGDALFAALRK